MKKLALMLICMGLILCMTMIASACSDLISVDGFVKQHNGGSETNLIGANVSITCIHNGISTTINTTVGNGGHFGKNPNQIVFPDGKCSKNDKVVVTATYNGQSMTVEAKAVKNTHVHIWFNCEQQVPEFGVVAGSVSVLGSIAGLVLLRKSH